ncbi:MAG: 3-hydroxyacyl-CoA dehydrogenase NAD-binding domain-containing protein [Bacteroidota bacterium]
MKVGIIGAGAMGSGIAQVAATANCEVFLFDTQTDTLEVSRVKLQKIMTRLIEKGRVDEATAQQIQSNIQYIKKLEHMTDCALVIEAIPEQPDLKKSVFKQLEAIVAADCIIASNTSSLTITDLAASLTKPERFLGIHFFNPAPLMKLVEIIPAIQTDPVVTAQAKRTIDDWGKFTVLAKDTPGFIVNKVARPFYSEALRIYEEGIADIPTIDWAMKTLGGFRMGPFELMDFIGHDVNYVVTETVFKAFYYDPRYKPAFAQKRLVEAGYLGRKSGRGFYQYGDKVQNPEPNQDSSLGQQIVNRIVLMLINEAVDTLQFGIATAEDIDTAMTKGVNYPKGLLAWANEIGIANCVEQLDALYDDYREDRYRCSAVLRRMARDGRMFFAPEATEGSKLGQSWD